MPADRLLKPVVCNGPLAGQLVQALGVDPSGLVALTLRMRVNELATITTVRLVEGGAVQRLERLHLLAVPQEPTHAG